MKKIWLGLWQDLEPNDYSECFYSARDPKTLSDDDDYMDMKSHPCPVFVEIDVLNRAIRALEGPYDCECFADFTCAPCEALEILKGFK